MGLRPNSGACGLIAFVFGVLRAGQERYIECVFEAAHLPFRDLGAEPLVACAAVCAVRAQFAARDIVLAGIVTGFHGMHGFRRRDHSPGSP